MTREVAREKAKRAIIDTNLTLNLLTEEEVYLIIEASADALQRECDLREGLIEMARSIITDAVSNKVDVGAVDRWMTEYQKIFNP